MQFAAKLLRWSSEPSTTSIDNINNNNNGTHNNPSIPNPSTSLSSPANSGVHVSTNLTATKASASTSALPTFDASPEWIFTQLTKQKNLLDGPAAITPRKFSDRASHRVRLYEDALKKDKLDMFEIRQLAFEGIPDAPHLRPPYWKILLYYLPLDRINWTKHLAQQRQMYAEWVKELVIDPHEKPAENTNPTPQEISPKDHPLSTEQDSTWNTYFKDQELLFEIDKDVRRTFPHLHFFQNPQPSPTASVNTKHSEALKRILFIYAKLNKGIKYVQGMNEVLAPIYYVFAADDSEVSKGFAEADSFYCFKNIMAEIMNNFIKSLDSSDLGIGALMKNLNEQLKLKDFPLWENLEIKKLVPQFYSFRWLTVLLSQEFQLPDIIRLWDSIFADNKRFQFMIYVCCAMIILVREQLLEGEFADNLKLLQNYPPTDVNVILAKAKELSLSD